MAPGWAVRALKLVREFPAFVDELEKFLLGNEVVLARTQDIGALPKEVLINGGVTGPMLRAVGVPYDLRKALPYGIYDRFKFRVPVGEKGDCYDRFMIRFLEMRESISILEQALTQLPEGQYVNPKAKLRSFKPPVGEAYAAIESPKGELGFHLISDGTFNPYRYRVRPPSFINLTLLEDMCLGLDLADVVLILGSVDIVLGEVDR